MQNGGYAGLLNQHVKRKIVQDYPIILLSTRLEGVFKIINLCQNQLF
jgi:hypothetical protein